MDGSSPLVSVVIPVFNGLPYLREALASIADQDWDNLEVIIVDGGSGAQTLDFLASVSVHVDHIEYLEPGTPVERTWTRCCELATGEFTKLLCQDDVVHPHAVASQVRALEAHPSAGLVFSRRDIIDADGRVITRGRGGARGRTQLLSGSEALLLGYEAGSNVYGEPLAVMFRTEVLKHLLPWDGSIPFLLDMSMYSKVMRDGPVLYLDGVVGAFRLSNQSWSTRLTKEQGLQYREWQHRVEEWVPGISRYQRLKALMNSYRIAWTRSLAYVWLGLRGRF